MVVEIGVEVGGKRGESWLVYITVYRAGGRGTVSRKLLGHNVSDVNLRECLHVWITPPWNGI